MRTDNGPPNTSWCIYHNGTGDWVPVSEFYKRPNGTMYVSGQSACTCKECMRQLRRLRYKQQGYRLRDRYSNAKANARRRGLEFTLPFEEYSTILAQPCVYSPSPPATDITVGLDRRDNAKGYVTGNCVPCCTRHNGMRSNLFTVEQAQEIAAKYGVGCGNDCTGRRASQDQITIAFKTPVAALQAKRAQRNGCARLTTSF